MPCGPEKYCDVTTEVLKCLRKRLAGAGVNVPSESSGSVSAHGVTGEFRWDEGAQTLVVLITDKPASLTCGEIFDVIDAAVGACGGQKC
jgi:hypothetical protein